MWMSYSIDMRERVVAYVGSGGDQVEASRLFGVSRKTIYLWLHRETLAPSGRTRRAHKIDPVRLAADVQSRPFVLLRERCVAFGSTPSGMWRALRRLKVTPKKNHQIF